MSPRRCLYNSKHAHTPSICTRTSAHGGAAAAAPHVPFRTREPITPRVCERRWPRLAAPIGRLNVRVCVCVCAQTDWGAVAELRTHTLVIGFGLHRNFCSLVRRPGCARSRPLESIDYNRAHGRTDGRTDACVYLYNAAAALSQLVRRSAHTSRGPSMGQQQTGISRIHIHIYEAMTNCSAAAGASRSLFSSLHISLSLLSLCGWMGGNSVYYNDEQ